MSLYLRKSISLCGLRLNFSKSGIGFSSGVKGLRFGIGPKGSYIHAGRSGVYYRKSLNVKKDGSDENIRKCYSREFINDFTDNESMEIVKQIKNNRRKIIFFPFAIPLCFIPKIG